MKLIPLEPDARLGRQGRRWTLAAWVLLGAAGLPLIRLQLGALGWEVIWEGARSFWWPMAALAAVGFCALLSYGLWLRRRPIWAPLLLGVPVALVVAGVTVGMRALPEGGGEGGREVLMAAAWSLSVPILSLFLAALVASAGALLLAGLSWSRARMLGVPWTSLTVAVATLVTTNLYTQVVRLPLRPFTSVVLGAALVALVLLEGPFVSDAPPDPATRRASEVPVALLLAGGAVLAALGAESLTFRAAALFAQGPPGESHFLSMALGGARAPSARLLSGLVPMAGVSVACGQLVRRCNQDRASGGRSPWLGTGVAVSLLLLSAGLAAHGAHRRAVSEVVSLAAAAAPVTPSAPSMAPTHGHEGMAAPAPRASRRREGVRWAGRRHPSSLLSK